MNMGVFLNKLYSNASDKDKKIIEDYLESKKDDLLYVNLYNTISIIKEEK